MPLQTKMRFGFGIFMVLLFAYTGWQAWEFARLARYLPLLTSGLGLLVGLLTIASDYANWRKIGIVTAGDVQETAALHGTETIELKAQEDGVQDAQAGADAGEEEAQETEDPRAVLRRSMAMMLWIVGYVVLISLVGLWVASAVFLIAFLRVMADTGWALPLVGAALIMCGMWVMQTLLNLQWPPYLVGGLLF